jgi:dephospho-CoA kinase
MPSDNSQRRDDRLIIGITGRIGAGKTSVGEHLKKAHRFQYVRYSQILKEWRPEDTDSRAHLQEVGWEVMAGGMQQEFNDRLIARIEPHSDCAVDGLRDRLDFENLSQTFPAGFRLLCIKSPEAMRWRRLRTRYPEIEDFRRVDAHPVEQQIELLCNKAFAILINDNSLEELYAKVDAVLFKIRPGGQT